MSMFMLIRNNTLAVLAAETDWTDFRNQVVRLFQQDEIPLPESMPFENISFGGMTVLVGSGFASSNPNSIENLSIAQIVSTLQEKLGGGKVTLTYVA